MTRRDLFNPNGLPKEQSWKERFSPKIVKVDGKMWVDTRFSRLLGLPPVMVAGMTPCTVAEPFVTACIKAGYHVELAGGGHFNEQVLRAKIDAIIEKVGIGCSITLNSLYLNPRLWAFQYPAVKAMRKEGYPIDGFTIGAGVPSFEPACEIVESLREAGIKHISFKPGSTQSIFDIVKVAQACPKMSVVIQWTGGRGGGHHSFEDFHGPVLETYSAIRRTPNIILVAGSGFGDGEGSYPYLTGSWSESLGLPAMPFDGILLGSRMMAAAENLASPAVKKLIVEAHGVPDSHWVDSYKKPVGGVVTVRSELGEPIHKIATRGILLWKEFDETIFNLPAGEKRMKVIREKRDYIISRLNADHQKIWFGKNIDGRVCDLSEMTYYEVARRLGELVYVWHQKRWIDITYKKLLELFLHRTEERFLDSPTKESKLLDHSKWNCEGVDLNPYEVIEPFFETYSSAKKAIINVEDIQAFLDFCAIPWHKPVPFIPTLDDDRLEYWFKKDSLWQAEDVDAIYEQDAQRVAILHGPVAAAYSKKVDEPVKDILDGINNYYIKQLTESNCEITVEEWFGGAEVKYPRSLEKSCLTETIDVQSNGERTILITTNGNTTVCDWLELLSGPKQCWLRALLRSSHIVQGPKAVLPNRVRALFKYRPGFYAKLSYDKSNNPNMIELFDEHGKVQVNASILKSIITVQVYYRYGESEESILPLKYHYDPSYAYALIRQMTDMQKVKKFYWSIWFNGVDSFELARQFNPLTEVLEGTHHIDSKQAQRFSRIVQSTPSTIPMDFCMVACWEAVMKALFSDSIEGDLLHLVHLSNRIETLDPYFHLGSSSLSSKARVMSIVASTTGTTVSVEATLYQTTSVVMRVSSAFFFRETKPWPVYFERKRIDDLFISIDDPIQKEIFLSKDYIKLKNDCNNCTLKNIEVLQAGELHELTGELVNKDNELVGTVVYKNTGNNAALEYFLRISTPAYKLTELEGYTVLSSTIKAPLDNSVYSECSGDQNPIHTNPILAEFVGLPGTITHGLWTSATVRSKLDSLFGRVLSWDVSFVDMVLPGQIMSLKAKHTQVRNGRVILAVELVNDNQELVLKGEAMLEQMTTAYVFTGQGSQEQGMGMDLYASSPIAKQIWDRSEAHFTSKYGFSILKIVRENPKEITVHFGGKKGAAIRQHYLSMTYDTEGGRVRLFPEVNEDSSSFTFTSPAGLLSMTQFTQPALTLVEMAAFETMRAGGFIDEASPFAGHSLGEYAALASVAQVLEIEALSDVVFYRGMCMQKAVKRDAEGRSPFGMAAVNPSRVKGLTEIAVKDLVKRIASTMGLLLEIVNYNVRNWQYVVAGHLRAIEGLTLVLNAIAGGMAPDQLNLEHFKVPEGIINPSRGVATIPLAGIDVPFHSSYLLDGVVPFRAFLSKSIDGLVRASKLVNKYIPNLTAIPFRLDREYIELVYKTSNSPILAELLQSGSKADEDELAKIILIELLAYQFSSPVRWIETQDFLFKQRNIHRFVEIGPAPTLCGMADRNLKMGLLEPGRKSLVKLLSHARDRDDLLYNQRDELKEVVVETEKDKDKKVPEKKVQVAVPVVTPVAASRIETLPLKAEEIVHILVAQKTRRPGTDIPMKKSIKEISAGKSTLQNELIGDLQKEFGSIPERAEELPIHELGMNIERSGFGGMPGTLVNSIVSKLFSAKMPSGFSASNAKSLLSTEFGLESKAADAIFSIAY